MIYALVTVLCSTVSGECVVVSKDELLPTKEECLTFGELTMAIVKNSESGKSIDFNYFCIDTRTGELL